jgi:hypothetical protein
MGLKAGAKRPPPGLLSGLGFGMRTASGKVGNVLFVFHFSAPRRGCGPVISTAVCFMRFSVASARRPECSGWQTGSAHTSARTRFAGLVLADEPGELRPAQPGHLRDLAPQDSLHRTALSQVFLSAQKPRDPLVHFRPARRHELNLSTAFQKRPDLLQAQLRAISHADFQYPACGPPCPSGSILR